MVRADTVCKVVAALENGSSCYDLYAHGRRRGDGTVRAPLCGKGTAEKIKQLWQEGKLDPLLQYFDENPLGEIAGADREEGAESPLALYLGMEEAKAHLARLNRLTERLASEIWTPPLHAVPGRDLSMCHEGSECGRDVFWRCVETGPLVLDLPGEDDDDFGCLRQHLQRSKLWRNLEDWKGLGGLYIRDRADLLDAIHEDIERHTGMPTTSKDATRGILNGFSSEIYRSLFPPYDPNENRRDDLTRKAAAAAKEGRWRKVADLNASIVEMFPDDVKAMVRAAEAHARMAEYDRAKEFYSRALEVKPGDELVLEELDKLKQECEIASIDGGRYRVVSMRPDVWLVAVFTGGQGKNIAWAYPDEIDNVIATFQELLRKYRSSGEREALLERRRAIDTLEASISRGLEMVTPEMLARTNCDRCLDQ